MQYTLTVYRDDDSTVWFEVSTDPAHPNPYLHEPGEIDAGEVDFLRGTATIGQVNLRVIDPQTGASQAERWLTERLGIPAGEEGEGHTALIGRRALLLRDGAVVLDGVIYSVALSESFAGFELQVRDIRERARKVKLFERTGTSTIFPRGVLGGYGQLPNGDWLVPPTRPVVCTFRHVTQLAAFTGIFDLSDRWRNGSPGYDADATVPPDLVFTDAMREAVRARDQQGRHIYVQIRWRPANGGAWTIIDAPRPGSVWPWNALFSTAQARLRDAGTRNREQVEAIHAISVSTFMQGPWPQDGQQVELLVVYTGPASEAYPFHWEGTAGALLQRVYDGDWSLAAPGIRYDPAALAALTTPVRLRVTEPVEDAREWTERYVYRAIGAAPALDAQGRISPVRAALPPDGVTLPEITDANAAPIPGWEHDASDAINIVRVQYQRDFRVPASEDPVGQASAGDGIATREVVVEHRAPQWAIDLIGEQVHEIEGIIFRALGGADGSPVTGDITDETGAQVAEQRARETLDRWLLGGQISACRVMASAFPEIRVGDWVIDSRSWRPNYATGQRGGSRLAQVVSVREVNPAWLEVVLVDGGPAAAPLGQPTLGTLSVTDDGVVSVPVTAVPAGGEAAVYYAVSTTLPPTDSPLWTFLGRTAMPATLTTPALPAGATVWVRARGEAAGRRPSPYTTPVSIVIPSTPRVSGVRILIADGVATVVWQPNQVAAGVRIYWDIHPRGVPPAYATSDVEASTGVWTVPETIPVGSAITVEVEPWTGWSGTAVSGTAGPRVVTTAIYDLGGPRREVPFDDGRFAVVALDPSGHVLDPAVTDAGGREVVRFFAKASAGAPDTADAIPDGTTKRVTTIEEAEGGGRAVKGLLEDGSVAPGKIKREVPFDDGKFAVIADDPAGERIAENVQDASGRPVVRFFAKASADQPDTADAIPDGTTKRVTTINEATGGGRAFQGLLDDGTVAPGKIRRDFPLADGKYAVTAQDPSGQVLDAVVKDADGREVRRFFAKASAEQPDTADAIPDGETKRVTTLDEAAGGARAFQGLLPDGTVGPGKIRRDLPFADGKYAVVAEDEAGTIASPAVTQSDGVAPRVLAKGHVAGIARDGQTVVFPQPFQHVPMVLLRGGISYEPRSGQWSPAFDPNKPQYDDLAALDLTVAGFTMYAKLRQKGTPTTLSHNFPFGNHLTAIGDTTEVTLSAAPSVNSRYKVHYSVTMFHGFIGETGTSRVTVAIDTGQFDSAGNLVGWTERATRSYSITGQTSNTWPHEAVEIAVSGLDSNDRIRIRIVEISSTARQLELEVHGFDGVADPAPGVEYIVATDNIASKTPDDDDGIVWEAISVS